MYIGIDLGTSNSVIAGVENGAAQIFRPTDGADVLPSAIYIDKRGHRLYGRRAYDQAMLAPENVATGFKRLMGTATTIEVMDQSLTPEECSAEIIRQLIGQATTETGLEKFDGVVIAIPAAFNQMQSEATLRAAKWAGLEKVDLIQEPVAAALAAMADAKRSGKFIIYDFGGGTFDVALVESDQGKVRIVAQEGVNMLGGRDFDRMIVSEVVRPWLLANFDLPDSFLRDPQYKRLARIALLAAERAKIDLSTLEEAAVFASDDEIRLTDESETEIFLDAPITRSQFEEMIRKHVLNTIDLIKRMLEENEVAPADVDRIVFIGGPSRIPLVRRLVTEELGIVADLKTDPMTAVAEGAAYYCESRLWQEKQIQPETTPVTEQTEAPKVEEETAQTVETLTESTAKPTQAHMQMEATPDLSFDYESRTPDEKANVTIRCSQQEKARRIRLMTEGWDSGMLPLETDMVVSVSLPRLGENNFDVQVMDESGAELDDHHEQIRIVRLVGAPAALPATHSIAVKVRKTVDADENDFVYLVKKGDKLPASGQLELKSGTNLKGGTPGSIGFELFQVEYPERVELNLCVGMFRIEGSDLPKGQMIRVGDPILFDWHMNEGGVLQTSVMLPASKMTLHAQRFYAPQAAEISYDGQPGHSFATTVLDRTQEEWGDLAAAVGPMAGPDIQLLKTRLDEQREILEESMDDADTVRRVCEEARFIRQDTVRLGHRHRAALLQRELGKVTALFNRAARSKAREEETKAFDALSAKIQKIIDANHDVAFPAAQLCLNDMRRIFFAVAWRDASYIKAWFEHLAKDSWMFTDKEEHDEMVEEGRRYLEGNNQNALRELVERMMDARLSLSASDMVHELANIVQAE